ncbi:MAG: 30S ribosomal protein S20 [Clostridiales bacterium]|nr:30S ribosomal protein S20 [Clostridiales bacterium]
MANIKSAKKRIKVSANKTLKNRRIKNSFRSTIKSFNRALAEGDFALAKDELGLAEKKLMKAAAKGTIHKNTASRKVSRLTRAYNKALAE